MGYSTRRAQKVFTKQGGGLQQSHITLSPRYGLTQLDCAIVVGVYDPLTRLTAHFKQTSSRLVVFAFVCLEGMSGGSFTP